MWGQWEKYDNKYISFSAKCRDSDHNFETASLKIKDNSIYLTSTHKMAKCMLISEMGAVHM